MLQENSTAKLMAQVLRSDRSRHPAPLTPCPPAQSGSNHKYCGLNTLWSSSYTIYAMGLGEMPMRLGFLKALFRSDLLEGPRNSEMPRTHQSKRWSQAKVRNEPQGKVHPFIVSNHRLQRVEFTVQSFFSLLVTGHASPTPVHPLCPGKRFVALVIVSNRFFR